jgi:TonB-dependent starch-binding outer membrane protein SusC
MPRLVQVDVNENTKKYSTYFLEDASYMKIKTAQLGYTLPKNITDKAKINRAKIYLSGQNLFTKTKYKGNDPEVGLSQGSANGNNLIINVDYGTVPQPRVITIGLDLTF